MSLGLSLDVGVGLGSGSGLGLRWAWDWASEFGLEIGLSSAMTGAEKQKKLSQLVIASF